MLGVRWARHGVRGVTIRPIRYLGDPVLRRPADPVRDFNDSIRLLIADMIESMHAAHGVGLAAPQIGVSLQIAVFGVPDREPFALINPRVVTADGTRRMDGEGCLSVPGYRAALDRSVTVVVEALDEAGDPVRIEAEDDLLAEALEHEVDHLNGILYVDRLDSIDDLMKLRGTGWVATDDETESAASEAAEPATGANASRSG
jgi:peptide deformylase